MLPAVSSRASRLLQFLGSLGLSSGIFLLLYRYPSYSSSAYWGAMMIASFAGWGFVLSQALKVQNAGLGEQIAWGFAFFLCAGGYLCVFSIAKPPVLAFFVISGAAAFLYYAIQTKLSNDFPRFSGWPAVLLGLIIVLLLSILYLAALFDFRFQGTDDHVLYLPLAKKMLATGTLLEPFSLRRATSYGGQILLLATFLTSGDLQQTNLPDEGLCRVAVLLVLWSFLYRRHKLSFGAMALTAIVMALLPDIRLNTTSMFSGTLVFLGLLITFIRAGEPGQSSVANGVLMGVLSAAAITLRGTHLVAVGVYWMIDFLISWKQQQRISLLQRYGAAVVALLISLGGWAIVLWRSSGTPMFPLIPGYLNPVWDAYHANSFQDYARLLVLCLKDWNVQQFLALGLIAVLVPTVSREDRLIRFLVLGSWFAFLLHLWPLAFSHAPRHVLRYSYSYLLPPLFYAICRALLLLERRAEFSLLSARIRPLAFSLVAASVLLFSGGVASFWGHLKVIDRQAHMWVYPPMEPASLARPYVHIQRTVPEGAPILSILEENQRLDFRRNSISILDFLGGFSPPPGMRSDRSAQELVAYFRLLNYRWLAAVRPENGFTTYASGYWEERARKNQPVPPFEPMAVIREMQQFLRLVAVLESSCRLVYDDGTLTMVDLNDCNFVP